LASSIEKLLSTAKVLAKKYHTLTGKPLGITGEVAEFTAFKLLKLKPVEARQPGYDATRPSTGEKIQIKGRCLPKGSSKGGRLGTIQLNKPWDTVVLVLMDKDFEVLSIYEAKREAIKKALMAPGSKARNVRGALAISKFKAIGKQIWPILKKSKRIIIQ
jgi:hypothetical protein